ncbi:hypothetical protein HKX48_006350 [Thoreauomyces humboldtii]|nr:hypothetical protein HKX48_006350 [Thoreauomyces humboldtii]
MPLKFIPKKPREPANRFFGALSSVQIALPIAFLLAAIFAAATSSPTADGLSLQFLRDLCPVFLIASLGVNALQQVNGRKLSARVATLLGQVEALKATSRLESIAFQSNPSFLCISNYVRHPDGNYDHRIVNINQVGMDTYNMPRERLIRKWAVAELGRDQAAVNESGRNCDRAKAMDGTHEWEQEYPRLNFTDRPEIGDTGRRLVNIRGLPLGPARAPDEGDYILLMMRDVTAERSAIMKLELLMEASADGFWEWDIAKDAITYGPKLGQLGFTPEEYEEIYMNEANRQTTVTAEGACTPVPSGYTAEGLKTLQAYRNRLLATKPGDDNFTFERQYLCKNGEYIWMMNKGKVVQRDANGAPLKVLGAHIDINRQKQVEETLKRKSLQLDEKNQLLDETNKELNQALKLKSEFLANISHELRTPLNGILGLGSVLWDTHLDNEQRDLLQSIRECSDGLLLIVNDVLDFSKMGAGKMVLECIPFDLRACVRNAVAVMGLRASEKKITLTTELDDRIPHAFLGDGNRLRQVCINLIGNAVKFTSTGGVRVVVSYLGDEEAPTLPQSSAKGGPGVPQRTSRIHFRVEDTGIGIPPDQFNRLFQPFSQIDASTARQFGGGPGLGLAISKELVTLMQPAHEGIAVESIPGTGSTFSFSIPLKVVEQLPLENQSRLEAEIEKTKRAALANSLPISLLLAEDNLVNQKVALRMLGQLGYSSDMIKIASNGEEAVHFASEADYDLILMDVQMPKLSGVEATMQIRLTQGTISEGGPGIVAMTANVLETDKQMCLQAGMDGHIGKPFKVEVLAEVLERFGRKVLARRMLSKSRAQLAASVERLEPLQWVLDAKSKLAQ